MALDTETLREWFRHFNRLCFQDGLPEPRLLLSRSRTRLGSMTCRRSRKSVFVTRRTYTLRVSTYYRCTEAELQDVLLHEMIHYYISLNNIRDTSPHGKVFRKMMTELNRRHGRHITVSSRMSGVKAADEAPPERERLVLALLMADGRRYLSVVNPHYAAAIMARLPLVSGLESHRWALSRDRFFDGFPTVRSLRGARVSDERLQSVLSEGVEMADADVVSLNNASRG